MGNYEGIDVNGLCLGQGVVCIHAEAGKECQVSCYISQSSFLEAEPLSEPGARLEVKFYSLYQSAISSHDRVSLNRKLFQ